MPIPITRAPGMMIHHFSRNVAPCVTSFCSGMPELGRTKKIDALIARTGTDVIPLSKATSAYRFSSSKKSDYSGTVTPKLIGLVGLRNTEIIVGTSVLRCRNFTSVSATAATRAAAQGLPEPYASVIKSLEPEFLKAGFVKIAEDNKTAKFSVGPSHFLRIAVLPNAPPALSFDFIGDKFNLHHISDLMQQFEPLAYKKRLSDLNAIIQQYGLTDDYTPDKIRQEGVRIYLLTICRQVFDFLESNKKELAELVPADIPKSMVPVREPYGSAIDFWEPLRLRAGNRLSEPYRSVIKLLEPELLKRGFKKTEEVERCVRFSFGTNQFFDVMTHRDNVSSIAAFYLDKQGNQAYISHLMKKFEPATYEKNISDQNAVRKKYRLDDQGTPEATRNEGMRIYLTLILRQIISFLDSNKKALVDAPHLL